ncbi:alkaline phytoceramidase [Auriscalpium vulgare]|uniref:Alkaline phytoceramidase n=1 Tax=Auriscalpium vulgare TaxID=40419 RepID=A0ACB8S2P4_9AGAM|nr:alkaline phytoceramidase [Auriscalpium vulgare]
MDGHIVGEHGFWGPVTATLDWCEANYQFSYHIAELANSFSNLVTVGVAVYGAILASKAELPKRYSGGFAGVALIGIGSFAFHATLLYEAQLADELPMIYVASYCVFVLFDSSPGFEMESGHTKLLLTTSLAFDALFTLSYLFYRNPVYHQIVFATLMLLVQVRAAYLVSWSEASMRIPDNKKSLFVWLHGAGTATFVLGFLIWNLDNIFCDTLTSWKRVIGWPAAFLLEGHSWWHVFTAIGSYYLIQGDTYLTLCIKDDHHKYRISRPLGLPVIQRTEKAKTL